MKRHNNKDPYSTNQEGSPAEEMSESAEVEAKEPPGEHELDMHHETLMKAEKIKSDKGLMKHLRPHMAMKMKHMKGVMGIAVQPVKITSIDGLRAKEKTLK